MKTPLQIKQEYQDHLVDFCLQSSLHDILHFFDISHLSADAWHAFYPADYHRAKHSCGQYQPDTQRFTACGECRTLLKAAAVAVRQRPELTSLFTCTQAQCPICANGHPLVPQEAP